MLCSPNSRLCLLAACLCISVISCTHRSDNDFAQCGGDSCAPPEPCVAPDTDGPYLWEILNAGTDVFPQDVGGSSDSDVYIACTEGVVLHYDGASWSIATPLGVSANTMFSGVFAMGPEHVFVAGEKTDLTDIGEETADDDTFPIDNGVVLHSDNGEWTESVRVGNVRFYDIWGLSPESVYVIGQTVSYADPADTGVVYRFDGASWTEMRRLTDANLQAVYAASDEDIFVVGSVTESDGSGLILHYDGTLWARFEMHDVNAFLDVWGSGEEDVYAVGDGIYHFDGSEWAALDTGLSKVFAPMYYSAVWGTGRSDIRIAGIISACEDSGGGAILHYDGESWTVEDRGIPGSFMGIWSSSVSDAWAVGKIEGGPFAPMILHYDGASNTASSL